LTSLAGGAAVNWNTNNGLRDATISCVAEDDAKNLWVGTEAGICRIDEMDLRRALNNSQTRLTCRLVSSAETMPDTTNAFGGLRAVLAPDGYMWFATAEGMLNVDTRRSEAASPVFPVYIESAVINGEPALTLLRGGLWPPNLTNETFEVPVDLRSLDIYYTALNFVAPQELQFRHKLEGSDADWVADAGARQAHYGRLPRGHYQFRVAARMADGPWIEAAESFGFTIPTPIYFQTWAIDLYILAAITLVAGTVRIISHRRLRRRLARLEQEQTLERERMRIARDMHDEMGSKLTKISFLSEHVQMDALPPGPALEKIQSIAQTSRDLLQRMDEIVWVVNPRNDTLENLMAYLSHYASEYFQNTKVECELRLPREIPPHPLSSEARHNLFLTFEEALNNVLKHSGATQVKVAMSADAREFELKVTDNGRGFDAEAQPAANGEGGGGRRGNGLRNMRQRLAALGGDFRVASTVGEGTTVTMRIKLSENSSK
jgi:signal transduction histidine kinase